MKLSKVLLYVSMGTLLIGSLTGLLQHLNLLFRYDQFAWASFFFFALTTFLSFLGFAGLRKLMPKLEMANFLMALIGLRLFACMGFVLGYKMVFNPPDKMFILPFFGLYILFTILEYGFMIGYVKGQSKK